MQISSATLAQWESVVAAVDPRSHQTMLYSLSGGTEVQFAGLVELDLAIGFTTPLPSPTDFLAAFPNAILVGGVSSP